MKAVAARLGRIYGISRDIRNREVGVGSTSLESGRNEN